MKGPSSIPRTEDNTWDIKINNQFDLSEQLQFQLTYIYYAPKNIPQGKQYARSSLDVGLKKILFKTKG